MHGNCECVERPPLEDRAAVIPMRPRVLGSTSATLGRGSASSESASAGQCHPALLHLLLPGFFRGWSSPSACRLFFFFDALTFPFHDIAYVLCWFKKKKLPVISPSHFLAFLVWNFGDFNL